jgi:hypothetical protein
MTVSAHNLAVMNVVAALGFKFTSPRATARRVRE